MQAVSIIASLTSRLVNVNATEEEEEDEEKEEEEEFFCAHIAPPHSASLLLRTTWDLCIIALY